MDPRDQRTEVYRNQTTTAQKIAMISNLRITSREEAIAFLRASSAINEQVVNILQRDGMSLLAARNAATRKVEPKVPAAPTPVVPVEDTNKLVAEDISEKEEHSEEEKKERISILQRIGLKKD